MFGVIPKPNSSDAKSHGPPPSWQLWRYGVGCETPKFCWIFGGWQSWQLNKSTWKPGQKGMQLGKKNNITFCKTVPSRCMWPGWNCCSSAPREVIRQHCLSCFSCWNLSPCQQTCNFNSSTVKCVRLINLGLSVKAIARYWLEPQEREYKETKRWKQQALQS